MKILHLVEQYAPSQGEIQEVALQLSERLSMLGHDVTIATSKMLERKFCELHGVKIVEFIAGDRSLKGFQSEIHRFREFVLTSDFDVVTVFGTEGWTSESVFPILQDLKSVKVFLPLGMQGMNKPEYQELYQNMPDILNSTDLNVFHSENFRDINFAKQHGVKHNQVISHGAAADEFMNIKSSIRKKIGVREDEFLIVNIGSFGVRKGQKEAIDIFFKTNLNRSVLLLAGSDMDQLSKHLLRIIGLRNYLKHIFSTSKRLVIANFKKDQIISALKNSDVFLFPSQEENLPLVLFEACAAGLPVLTSDCGNAKEILDWTGAGEILPTYFDEHGKSIVDIDQSVRILEDLAADEERLEQYSLDGFNNWLSNFTWEHIGRRYESSYKQLLSVKD